MPDINTILPIATPADEPALKIFSDAYWINVHRELEQKTTLVSGIVGILPTFFIVSAGTTFYNLPVVIGLAVLFGAGYLKAQDNAAIRRAPMTDLKAVSANALSITLGMCVPGLQIWARRPNGKNRATYYQNAPAPKGDI